jgi:hypothetical protein
MDVEDELRNCVELVVGIAQTYLPMLKESTFSEIFKLSPTQVASHCHSAQKTTNKFWIRNILMFLYWARHYPSMRALGALFGLSKTQSCDIVHEMMNYFSSLYPTFVNLSNTDFPDDFFLPWTVGIVDCTEIVIQSWIPVSSLLL